MEGALDLALYQIEDPFKGNLLADPLHQGGEDRFFVEGLAEETAIDGPLQPSGQP